MENKDIQELSKQYDEICDKYLKHLNAMWDVSYGYWVAEERGGLYCFNDEYAITMENIKYSVENGVSYDEFLEWNEYENFIANYGGNHINLKSWHNGYHGIPLEERERIMMEHEKIEEMKREFEKQVSELTSKY